jgi:predicted YcjX-like family ATPase
LRAAGAIITSGRPTPGPKDAQVLSRLTSSITRTIEDTLSDTSALFFDPVVRLGVTGLSRAGKTIFITSLVANLLNRARMPQLKAEAQGRIMAAYLQPQPDHSIARFAYEDHLAALTGPAPHWPEGTRSISTLRLSLKVKPAGFLTGLTGTRTVHLDIVDYPGEWLLDLPLMEQDYATWSAAALDIARGPGRIAHAEPWLALVDGTDPATPLDEVAARDLAAKFTAYLAAARASGLSSVAPGRFLMPGDLEGSPALTFSPLPRPERTRSGSLWRAFETRYEAYKRLVVGPFFRNHFAKLDRQIVLIDALGAIHDGPRALEDLRTAMAEILTTFRPGQSSWLAPLLGRRIDRILFAATKADYLHHEQHAALTAITEALVSEARARARFRGAETGAMSIASVRATVEQTLTRDGREIGVVRGRRADTGVEAALFPGRLPTEPGALLAPARTGAAEWLDAAYSVTRFAPPILMLAPGEAPPHIRLDRAADFLIGDYLA